MTALTQSPAWLALKAHYEQVKDLHTRDLFAQDPERFKKFSVSFEDFLLDYSKNRITDETLKLLFALAQHADVKGMAKRMFAGEKINITENRAVLHTALRNRDNHPILVDGVDVMPEINAVLAHMRDFTESVRSGQWTGYTGKAITDVVNIGIGGSDLGPVMVTEALKPYGKAGMTMHFVSNIDGTHIAETLKVCDPETTLFLVASKTFTTQETITNAHSAREWFLATAKDDAAVAKHFVALSTNKAEVEKFGIDSANMFGFWDWVGGRYSLWSAIGLSIALYIGMDYFEDLLTGANDMDQHFLSAPPEQNLPMILGVLGVWYNNFFGAETEAILPYDQYLHRFAAYFPAGRHGERTARSVNRDGERVSVTIRPAPLSGVSREPTGSTPFYQLIHQGTKTDPLRLHRAHRDRTIRLANHHPILLSNFFAQTEALMKAAKPRMRYAKELGSAGDARVRN